MNTPHNSSPVADAVTEFIPKAPLWMEGALKIYYGLKSKSPSYLNFIRPAGKGLFDANWEATDAVKDLQVKSNAGGKNLPQVTVKNHLITRDVNIYSAETAELLGDLEPYMDLLDDVLKIMKGVLPPGPAKNFVNSLKNTNQILCVLPFIEWYSEQKGFPNFLGDGDLIVPLGSQLASRNVNSTTVKVFNNNGFLDACHIKITDRTDVGNWVKKFLNSGLSSDYFASTITATPTVGDNLKISQELSSLSPKLLSSLTSPLLNESFDKVKVEILSPIAGDILLVDSTVNIRFALKDTVELSYIDVNFQGNNYTLFSTASSHEVTSQIDPSFTGRQLLSVTAAYNQTSGTVYYTDTITVNVQTVATLSGFEVSPYIAEVRKDFPFFPDYSAIYDTYIATVSNDNDSISIFIADPLIASYDTERGAFIALSDTGSTYAIIGYKGFADTIYLANTSPLHTSTFTRTISSGNWKNPAIWETGVVPGISDSAVIMPSHNVTLDSTTQIRALYISANAILNKTDSVLQIGDLDDGNKNLVNNGTLNISNGTITLNGRLQLSAGSVFNMFGGQLVIDGNTCLKSHP